MEITPALMKRLQEVGRALSETDVLLLFYESNPVNCDINPEKEKYVIITSKTSWAENEAQEWVAISARRDHVYAHVRYTSTMVWKHFILWAKKQEEIYKRNLCKGFPSSAFAMDIFIAIEDARVEHAWALEYPGTSTRISYYNTQCAKNIHSFVGIEAMIMGLYYTALLGDIPHSLVLSEEEFNLIKRARPLIEKGRRAGTTLEAREYVKKILEVCRSYLIDNQGEYKQLLQAPGVAAETPEEVPFGHGPEDNLSGRDGINYEFDANDSESQGDLTFNEDKNDGHEPFDNNPENRSQAFSTPGHGQIAEENAEDQSVVSKDQSLQSPEEEYQQLLAGAGKVLTGNTYRDDRTKFIIKRQLGAEQLEKGIHEHIILLDLDPEDLEKYYHGDLENLTPVSVIKNKYRKQTMDLSRQIKEVLLYKKTLPERNLRKGWPDSGNLWKLSMGETSVFQKKSVEAARPDVSVMFLVDCSRSMRRNSRSELCKQSLVVAAEALEKNQVKYAIEGFTTGTNHNTVVNIKFKHFDEVGIDNLDCYSGFRENRDGYSIRRAAQSILRRPEKKKILIVLSDSVPNHTHVNRAELNYSFEMGKGIKDTIIAIRETGRKGVVVVGVYFGNKSDIDRVRPIYPNFVCCEVLSLPRVLGSVLRRCLR